MNDPQVIALEYSIEYGPEIDWSKAAPLDIAEENFDIRVENGRVRFSLKTHYGSEVEAKSAIENEYIPNWEFHVGLDRGPDTFRLRFDKSDIVDRNPQLGANTIGGNVRISVECSANLSPPMPRCYPKPNLDIRRSPDIDSMYHRYLGYVGGKEPLTAMAYFCLTVLESMAGGRKEAQTQFRVSRKVLKQISRLCSVKGGPDARKAEGRNEPHTQEEERFLKIAIKKLIRRAAEVEYNPKRNFEQITKSSISG